MPIIEACNIKVRKKVTIKNLQTHLIKNESCSLKESVQKHGFCYLE